MSYQIFPTIIFFLAIFAAIAMVLRRLPEAQNLTEAERHNNNTMQEKLIKKGLPALEFSKFKHHSVFLLKKIWRFILEAKDVVPTGAAVLKVKKLFPRKDPQMQSLPMAEETGGQEEQNKTENYFLNLIKKEPRELSHYDNLGEFYLENHNYNDARDIYLYLTSHASGVSEYWARLGFASFRTKDFKGAADAYRKSLGLDSSQPNRYYNLAQSLKAINDLGGAKDAIEKAVEMDPQNQKFLELKNRLG